MKFLSIACIGSLMFIFSCDLFTGPSSDDYKFLNVKFENAAASEFIIFSIQLMAMGPADAQTPSPSGIWGDNLLVDGSTLAPGEHEFYSLDIPNLHWSRYRLGVLDENNTRVFLDNQQDTGGGALTGTITHWGSDDRTVAATVVRDETCDCIVLSGYSDFAGID